MIPNVLISGSSKGGTQQGHPEQQPTKGHTAMTTTLHTITCDMLNALDDEHFEQITESTQSERHDLLEEIVESYVPVYNSDLAECLAANSYTLGYVPDGINFYGSVFAVISWNIREHLLDQANIWLNDQDFSRAK